MTSVMYYTCDRCGAKDDHDRKVFHHIVQDMNRMCLGHLCTACVKECLPLSQAVHDLVVVL